MYCEFRILNYQRLIHTTHYPMVTPSATPNASPITYNIRFSSSGYMSTPDKPLCKLNYQPLNICIRALLCINEVLGHSANSMLLASLQSSKPCSTFEVSNPHSSEVKDQRPVPSIYLLTRTYCYGT